VEEHAPGLAITADFGDPVALDTRLDADLLAEGLARDFVNRVQNMRKAAGFEVIDRIRIRYQAPPHAHRDLQKMSAYIKNETLANELAPAGSESAHLAHREEWNLGNDNNDVLVISISRE
jgi:isoleucyl-tRNA synthetase